MQRLMKASGLSYSMHSAGTTVGGLPLFSSLSAFVFALDRHLGVVICLFEAWFSPSGKLGGFEIRHVSQHNSSVCWIFRPYREVT
jgi:hypothetical protein